jgi:hemerythrin
MAYFNWQDSYSVGITVFDRHHKNLIDLINKLHEAMRAGKASQELNALVANLADYTQLHFSSEEKLLAQHAYPNLSRQVSEHNAFKAKIADFQAKLAKGQIGLSIEVMDFLKNWLANHILGEDQKYGPFLQSKGVK